MAAASQDGEESPDSTRQRCRVTPGRGNPRESATENSLPLSAGVMVKRWGKSPPRFWQQRRHGKPHREQCQIGNAPWVVLASHSGLAARGVPVTVRQDEWSSKGLPVQSPDKIRLIGPPRIPIRA